jgi:hypothetical protein
MGMRLGLVHVSMRRLSRPAALAAAARAAEAAGFDSLWAGEHVVLPDPQVPPSPMAAREPALDPLFALTWAAAHTSTVRLVTGIVVLPQRNPVVLAGWTGRLVPLTVDGLIYASSRVMLDSARRKVRVPPLARWLLGLGIAATLAANVAHGLGHGPSGAVVAAWPAVALVGSYELLMVIIRSGRLPAGAAAGPEASGAAGDGRLRVRAAEEFAGEVATGRVPSVRMIRARLHVGQPRAQRVRAYLAALGNP